MAPEATLNSRGNDHHAICLKFGRELIDNVVNSESNSFSLLSTPLDLTQQRPIQCIDFVHCL